MELMNTRVQQMLLGDPRSSQMARDDVPIPRCLVRWFATSTVARHLRVALRDAHAWLLLSNLSCRSLPKLSMRGIARSVRHVGIPLETRPTLFASVIWSSMEPVSVGRPVCTWMRTTRT